MHQGSMLSIQRWNTLAQLPGTKRVSPERTASAAAAASPSVFMNHWSVMRGSRTTPERSPKGCGTTLGSILSISPRASRASTARARASKRSRPRNGSGTASFMRPSTVITSSGTSPWRSPTAWSLKSWAGVIFTAPLPCSGSACSSVMIGMARPVSGSVTSCPTRSR